MPQNFDNYGEDSQGNSEAIKSTGGALHALDPGVPAAVLTNVASDLSSVLILAANAARRGLRIHNDGANTLSIKFGTTASSTSYTVKLLTQTDYEMKGPGIYTGIIDGIWDTANGSARVTEW